MKTFCEGFYFQYYQSNRQGKFRQVKANPLFREVEDKIIARIRTVLRGRPDLLRKISCLTNAIEVRIYDAPELMDKGKGGEFVGRVTQDGDHITMEFAIGETLYGLENTEDGFEVITHELAHILDFISEIDGVFPGWTPDEIQQYQNARDLEQHKIREGTSPMAVYALVNDEEFLAVLAETFFEKPWQLYESNPILYNLMQSFFQVDPMEKIPDEAMDKNMNNLDPV